VTDIMPMLGSNRPMTGMARGPQAKGARRVRTLPPVSWVFWTIRLLVVAPAAMIGQIINQWKMPLLWPATLALICMALAGAAATRIASARLASAAFWAATFGIAVLTTILAERVDLTLGIGDIPAGLHLAAIFMLCSVLDYRLTGAVATLPLERRQKPFFWTLAVLAQMLGSAVADWALDPGGPGAAPTFGVLAAALLVVTTLHSRKPASSAIPFWAGIVIAAAAGALGPQMLWDGMSTVIR
jgi:uncharacterized membrane-anchored protein